MLAIIIGGVITIEVWTLFPSSTPAAFQNIPPNIAASLGLVVSPGQGEWLVQLSREGLKTLAPEYFVGVVGFPSYHTVLAVVSVVYAFKMRFIWLPFLALNTLMLPAILLHGSHNLVDVFGGLAVSAVSVWIAGKIADAKPASADLRPNAVIQA